MSTVFTPQAHAFAYGGLLLTGVDAFGAAWTVERADGWHGSPPIRSARQARTAQDGEWDYTPHRAGRTILLQGRVTAPDLLGLEQAARRLSAAQVRDTLVGASVFGELSALATLEDAPQFDPISDTKAVWQVTVVTTDPLLYGVEAFGSADLQGVAGTGWVWPAVWPVDWGVPAGTTPGAVTVANAGTASYWPRLRVDGPVTNPTIQLVETGAWVRFNGVLAAGQWLDFVLADRRVLLNGQVSRRQAVTSSGDWLAVPPGGGSVAWTADDADPAAQLSVWSYSGAWI